jgi:hypothetical protein
MGWLSDVTSDGKNKSLMSSLKSSRLWEGHPRALPRSISLDRQTLSSTTNLQFQMQHAGKVFFRQWLLQTILSQQLASEQMGVPLHNHYVLGLADH